MHGLGHKVLLLLSSRTRLRDVENSWSAPTQGMQNKVSTFLWFESNANEAANLYCSIFPISKITGVTPMSTSFEIEGQRFIAFNGGPHHKLTAAVSLFVSCNTQEEVDALWGRFLADGGKESQCGWLVDKFGLSWQIIPRQLLELMADPDPVVANRVVQCMLGMQKIDIAALQAAHRG
jgi:predicted 3-demethylubiquinone-9 3-methyltransferase (glyoxalase superfamily)